MLLMMGGIGYVVVTLGPTYMSQIDTNMSKAISNLANQVEQLKQQKPAAPMKQIQQVKPVASKTVQKRKQGSKNFASAVTELFGKYEVQLAKSNGDVADALKDLAQAVKDQPQPIFADDEEAVHQEKKSQVVDWKNTIMGEPLSKNQTNPWSPILNGHVRQKFKDLIGNPRRFRLCYNATEMGWARKNFVKSNCMGK